jgi:hypothetical protein
MPAASRPSCRAANPRVARARAVGSTHGLRSQPPPSATRKGGVVPLVVGADPAHCRARFEHHGARRIRVGSRSRRVRRSRVQRRRGFRIAWCDAFRLRRTRPLEHGVFDLRQVTHLASVFRTYHRQGRDILEAVVERLRRSPGLVLEFDHTAPPVPAQRETGHNIQVMHTE